MQHFNLNRLAIFVRVVETRSLSEVALELGLNKSTVSREITALEDSVKAQLLYRSTREIRPTSLGEQLYSKFSVHLHELENVAREQLSARTTLDGLIRVTALEDMGVGLLVPIIADFTASYPKLRFDLRFSSDILNLVKESVDVALRVGPVKLNSLRIRKVGEMCFHFVASPQYMTHHRRPTGPHDLLKLNLMTFRGFRTLENGLRLVNGSENLKLAVEPYIESTSTMGLMDLTLAGRGVALLPNFLTLERLRAGTLVRVCPGWQTPVKHVSLVTPSRSKLSPAVSHFMDFAAIHLAKSFKQ